MGYIPKAVESFFITNSDIHKYNIRNKDKMRSAYGKHEFMYSNFRFVGIHIWNYILDHLCSILTKGSTCRNIPKP